MSSKFQVQIQISDSNCHSEGGIVAQTNVPFSDQVTLIDIRDSMWEEVSKIDSLSQRRGL